MAQVLLDGTLVESRRIMADKHRFVGMYRPPVNPADEMMAPWLAKPTEVVVRCSCGVFLMAHQNDEHFAAGHFDIEQYESIA